jgi:hypothetical protein
MKNKRRRSHVRLSRRGRSTHDRRQQGSGERLLDAIKGAESDGLDSAVFMAKS